MSDTITAEEYREIARGAVTLEQVLARRSSGALLVESQPAPAKARVCQAENRGSDGLNQTERMYRDEELEVRLAAGLIASYRTPAAIKFRVGAERCWFEPDAWVVELDGTITLVDVKRGRLRKGGDRTNPDDYRPLAQDDAVVKIKSAALLYPELRWSIAWRLPEKAGGGWREKVYG